ncbi:TPA: DNA binding protein [Pseudomonas aeruginosa]|nr:DNA binding protein [Pseudomonas aeruginosa]
MSRLAEFRKLEEQLAQQLAELEALKNDESLKREIEFEEKLRTLMAEYGVDLRGLIAVMDPQYRSALVNQTRTGTASRKARQIKVYVHPETGERVETKGGNHAVLKAWKAEYGAATVESWLVK